MEVVAGESGKASAVRFSREPQHQAADEAAGAYLLRTSHVDWDTERILRAYWELTEVEASFRSLKSELGLRPIWHHLDRRVSTHLFVAVLAYHAVHLVRTRLKARGVHLSWQSIRDRLANWVRVTTTVQSADGQPLCSRQDVRPGAAAYEIARAAGLEPKAHRQQIRKAD